MVGFQPSADIFDLPELGAKSSELYDPDTVLFDAAGRPEFGPVAKEFGADRRVITEVAGRRIQVVGLFTLGTSFGVDGTLITSNLTFFRLAPAESPDQASIGLVMLDPAQMQKKSGVKSGLFCRGMWMY